MKIRYKETKYGFDYGAASVTRIHSDENRGCVFIGLSTPKHKGHGIEIYVTKTGKVRISCAAGEWIAPRAIKKTRRVKV